MYITTVYSTLFDTIQTMQTHTSVYSLCSDMGSFAATHEIDLKSGRRQSYKSVKGSQWR